MGEPDKISEAPDLGSGMCDLGKDPWFFFWFRGQHHDFTSWRRSMFFDAV